MIFISDTGEIESTLVDLMKQYKRYRWAVAWASVGFGAWDALVRHKGRIHRIVIGTQFHQTHPKVISLFHRHPGVRFVRDPSGVFHHKIYLFENGPKSWTAVIGSANFTQAAFKQNKESVVIIDADDEGADKVKNAIDRCLNDSWSHADRNIDQQWVRFYTDGWERKMERLRRLANRFGSGKGGNGNGAVEQDDDGGLPPVEIPLLSMNWASFVQSVADEARRSKFSDHTLEGRLRVLDHARDIFSRHRSFADMSYEDRRRIGGFQIEEGVDWLWFGSMLGAGRFMHAVKNYPKRIAAAIDAIPGVGVIRLSDYKTYVAAFRKIPGYGLATATRLLGMKRPETFLPVNVANARLLKRKFGIKHQIDLDTYWGSVIMRIQESSWWNAPRPTSGKQRKIWDGRAAMLDALLYEPHRR